MNWCIFNTLHTTASLARFFQFIWRPSCAREGLSIFKSFKNIIPRALRSNGQVHLSSSSHATGRVVRLPRLPNDMYTLSVGATLRQRARCAPVFFFGRKIASGGTIFSLTAQACTSTPRHVPPLTDEFEPKSSSLFLGSVLTFVLNSHVFF